MNARIVLDKTNTGFLPNQIPLFVLLLIIWLSWFASVR